MPTLSFQAQFDTHTFQVRVHWRFQCYIGRIRRLRLWLGELSWTAGRGGSVIHQGPSAYDAYQWWDVMQEIALQVNRPRGWGFQNIAGGEIKYMKLWQVSIGMARPVPRGY